MGDHLTVSSSQDELVWSFVYPDSCDQKDAQQIAGGITRDNLYDAMKIMGEAKYRMEVAADRESLADEIFEKLTS